MRTLVVLLVLLLAGLQYRLWFADGGLVEVQRLQRAIERQEARNDRLRERNRALAAEVRDLKQGLDAVESRARSELGMVREGERFYQVVEPPQRSGDGAGE